MENHLVEFENLTWVDACKGMRYKKYENDHKVLHKASVINGEKMRMLSFEI